MTKDINISGLDISLMRKYVSNSLNDEETYYVNAFLSKHPEYKEILEGLTLADLDKIEQVSLASNARVQRKVNGGQLKRIGWVAAAVTVLVIGSLWYQQDQGFDFKDNANVTADTSKVGQELVAIDTSMIVPEIYHKEIIVDTFYYLNRDEQTAELAIEYIEEKESTPPIQKEKKVDPNQKNGLLSHQDSLPQSVTMLADNTEEKEDKVKQLKFVATLDYRQSVAVESNYAAAYKVGQTKSFAGPIGGYEYESEGMPVYGSHEQDFYVYLEAKLSSDTLLTKITKKMEAKVSFEVDHKGRVENVNVVKCNHKQLCLKLTEIFENFPDWQPADFKGKKGSVHYVIQVNYE